MTHSLTDWLPPQSMWGHIHLKSLGICNIHLNILALNISLCSPSKSSLTQGICKWFLPPVSYTCSVSTLRSADCDDFSRASPPSPRVMPGSMTTVSWRLKTTYLARKFWTWRQKSQKEGTAIKVTDSVSFLFIYWFSPRFNLVTIFTFSPSLFSSRWLGECEHERGRGWWWWWWMGECAPFFWWRSARSSKAPQFVMFSTLCCLLGELY